MKTIIPALSLLLCAASPGPCDRYADIQPPPAAGDAQPAAALKGCKSENLYYGIGMPVDYAKARQCALLEEGKSEPVFGGTAVLMMIYANGAGVRRDYDLALHYACRLDGAPAEMEARVAHLEALKTKSGGEPFDLCDDITSGFMGGQCAAHAARMEDVKRDARLAAIGAAVPAASRKQFDTLQAAAAAFIKARVANEVDLSGTARGMFQVHEEQISQEDYVQMLESFAAGKPHRYAEHEAQTKAAELDRMLGKIAATSPDKQKQSWGTITADGIAKAQQAWTAYRDAFAAYAAGRYAGVSAASVSAWLTAKRIHMLKPFLR